MQMNLNKLIALVTTMCFIFSSVCVPAVTALHGDPRRIAMSVPVTVGPLGGQTDDLGLMIPATAGRVTESKLFDTGTVVINVQDLHCAPEVQRNITRILEIVDAKFPLNTVFVEGAAGDVDTSWLAGLKDRKLRKDIAEELANSGLLTGTEYYSILHDKPRLLKGLEDRRLHRSNIIRLGKMLDRKPFYEAQIKDLSRDLAFLEAKYLNSRNRKFNRTIEQYRYGHLSPEKFYTLLFKYAAKINPTPSSFKAIAPIRMENYPNISGYLKSADIAHQLRYKRIKYQCAGFIRELKSILPYRDYNSLAQRTDNFSKLDQAHLYITELARRHNLDIAGRYPDLALFLAYREQDRGINPVRLIQEENELIGEIRAGLSHDGAALEVSFLADFFYCFQNYLLNKLTADDYAYFTQQVGEFKTIWGKYVYINRLPALDGDYALLDDYYRVNIDRNTSFIKNISPSLAVSSPEGAGKNVIVLVTGGFHTEGIKRLLTEQKISYMTVMPNVSGDTTAAGARYSELARQQAKVLSNALQLTILSQQSGSETMRALAQALWRRVGNQDIDVVVRTLHDMGYPTAERKDDQINITVDNKPVIITREMLSLDISLKGRVFDTLHRAAPFVRQSAGSAAESYARLMLPLFEDPLDFVTFTKNLFNSLAYGNTIVGDGLIDDVKNNPALAAAIRKWAGVLPENLGKMPDPVQEMIMAVAQSDKAVSEISDESRSILVKALLAQKPIRCFTQWDLKKNKKDQPLSKSNEKYLRDTARQIWGFYADNVNADSCDQPPDNVRMAADDKIERTDYRTSPTNMGLYLASVTAALKMRYISETDAYKRIGQTLDIIEGLEKYEGHLFNWYGIDGTPKEINGRYISTVDNGNFAGCLIAMAQGLGDSEEVKDLKDRALKLVREMHFEILYDDKKGLLYGGGVVKKDEQGRDKEIEPDQNHYDMVMSEARTAYMVAIIKGDIPEQAWRNLKGKVAKGTNNRKMQIQSWSGTMFESFMPRLLMKEDESTPLGRAARQAFEEQRKARIRGLWGISEAAAALFGLYPSRGYQGDDIYAAWGVRSTGQATKFMDGNVIAPYASMMAAVAAPNAVARNLRALQKRSMRGRYGFYESVAIVKSKKRMWSWPRSSYKIMRRFYAHHQGMAFLGLVNALENDIVTEWFHASPFNKDGIIERLLKTETYAAPDETAPAAGDDAKYRYEPYQPARQYDPAEMIGNESYLVYAPETGWSSWGEQGYALAYNKIFYVKDRVTGTVFPVGLQPPVSVTRENGRAVFTYSVDLGDSEIIHIEADVSVSPVDMVETWNLRIVNTTSSDRAFEVTGYQDWIMDNGNAYLGHPVYRNLFVNTAFARRSGVITAQRRTVQGPEQDQQAVGFFALGGRNGNRVDGWDTSRLSFLGRLGSLTAPVSIVRGAFKKSSGYTLNPAGALSKTLKVKKGESADISFLSGSAESPEMARETVARYRGTRYPRTIEYLSSVPELPSNDTFMIMRELKKWTDRGLRIKGTPVNAPEALPDTLYEFSPDGSECIIKNPLATKKPWAIVVSNGVIGFVATAAGSAYSFFKNSQQSRETPYSPDMVAELPLRGVMVKNTETGEEWSLTPGPRPSANGKYEVRVSPGYIRYIFTGANALAGLTITMTMFVDKTNPVEFWNIDAQYAGKNALHLELSSFVKWALGQNYPKTADQTRSKYDEKSGAIFAQSTDSIFPGSVAFHALAGGEVTSGTAMSAENDPFDGLNVKLAFTGNEEAGSSQHQQVSFLLGQADNEAAARNFVKQYRDMETVQKSFKESTADIREKLGTSAVKTPDGSFNALINNWLPYQAYYAHILARSGMNQSGGAFGFRDQLQSFMNLLATGSPFFNNVAREHIIESTRHQFERRHFEGQAEGEMAGGDVQHWWHPHNNFGQRSRISDNLLWLPYALSQYINTTGDTAILDKETPYIALDDKDWEKGELRAGENDRCFVPQRYTEPAPVYEHARNAIDRALDRMGAHGLPLIGTGDWNDALSRVGPKGTGESVWLGFFLYDNLNRFAAIAELRGDTITGQRYREEAIKLKDNLEKFGWDPASGSFIRAYTDSGEKLDFVDAIVQSWAVISGGASESHARNAVQTAVKRLYRAKHQIVLLFDRAVDKLIDYPPGIRENMAQYTHGATWTPMAVAILGDGDRAYQLYQALLPTTHAHDPRYGAEPYAVAADIYGPAKKFGDTQEGEAGWTWYSGGPGWIYRIGIEYILGMRFKDGNRLEINPCIPKSWKTYSYVHHQGKATYTITVNNPAGVSTGVRSIIVDGVAQPAIGDGIVLKDDGQAHTVTVVMDKTGALAVTAVGTPPGDPLQSLRVSETSIPSFDSKQVDAILTAA